VFFSDRLTVEHADGARTYLCTLCDADIRSSRTGKRLTDAEVRDIVANGSMAAISLAGGGRYQRVLVRAEQDHDERGAR
jgi:hypothetical protein